MVGVLDRKLLREVRGSRSLLLTISSIMTLGVMCFVYMRSSYYNLRGAQAQYYAQCRMADFWVEVKKVPLAELDAVARLPGVSEIRPRIQFFATVDLENVEEPLNGLTLSLPDRPGPIINDIVLRRGSYFTDRRREEVIVNDAFARAHDLHPGQTIHLLLNNRREELFIVGTAISSEFVYLLSPGSLAPDPKRFGVFYLKQSYAEEVFDFDGAANQVLGLLSPAVREGPAETLARIETLLEPYGVFNVMPRKDQASNRFLSDEIRGLGVFSTIMPTIFLSVAALVLNVLMLRLIDQQRVVIGTLKAVGYGDGQIFLHFLKFGLIIGMGGGLTGCVAGYFMAGFVTSIYKQFYEFPELANLPYPFIYLGGLAISAACALLGCVTGARSALRLQPAQAMRPAPPAAGGGPVWLERFTGLWRRLSFGWRMALRNVIRNRLRTAVGVFAGAMGAALLLAGFMMRQGMNYLIEFQYEKVLTSDLDLSFADDQGRPALREARGLPGVDHAEPVLEVACHFVHGPYRRKGAITGLAADARLTRPRDLAGRPIPLPSAGLAVSRKLAQVMQVGVGDRLLVTPVKGRREPFEAPVVQITDSYMGMAVYADIAWLSRQLHEELATSGVQLQVGEAPAVRRKLNRELKRLPALQSVSTRGDSLHNLRETIVKVQGIFIGLLVIFAGVIYFGSVLNASLVSLAERRREVATLAVLGYSPYQIGGLFFRESVVVTLLGTALGLPLGYGLTLFIAWAYDTEMFRFPVVSPPAVWISTVTLGISFGVLAHLVVLRQIFKLDWLSALQVRE